MRRGLVLAFSSLLAVGAATGQEPTVGAAVNEFSGEALLSPGVLAAIFGQNLTEGCMDSAPAGAPWPTTLCNMQVLVNDEPAAILSASPGEFHVQLPVDAQSGPATLTLQQPSTVPLSFALGGRVDAAHELAITLETHAPGIFSVTHADLSAISMGSPAIPGETLRITATGLGPTSPPVGTGEPGPLPPAVPVTMPDVKIADMDALVQSASLSSGFVGIFDVAFTLPADLEAGTHAVTLEIGGQASKVVMVAVGGAPPTVGGIVSSASFAPNAPAAAGSILAVFGQNFGMTNGGGLFPSTEFKEEGADEGVSVLFDGTPAPLFGVFGNTPFPQINVLAPTDLPEMGQVQVEVTNSAGTSDMFMLAMAPAATGIYRADLGRMYAAALVAFDADVPNRGPTRHLAIPASTAATLGIPTNCKADEVAALADCGEPVSPGVILQIFLTGLGKATPGGDPEGDPLPTGMLNPGGYNTVETPEVTIGGMPAIVDFSGLAPGFSGLYQINARVPLGAQAGDQVPLTIRMPSEAEGDTSNIAIAAP